MTASSTDPQERARKNLAAILNRLSKAGQSKVAEAMQVHESTISKWKSGDLENFAKLLAVLELKCVSSSKVCYTPKQVDVFILLAKERMAMIDSHRDLEEDEE